MTGKNSVSAAQVSNLTPQPPSLSRKGGQGFLPTHTDFLHAPLFSRFSILITLAPLLLNTACSSTQTLSQQSTQTLSKPVQNTSTKVSSNSNTSTLRLGYISTSSAKAPTGPTGWALHKGKLKPELQKVGITEVQLLSFPNGPNLNEALVAGAVDVGIYGDTPALVARANGIPTRLINQEQVGTNAWLLAKKNGPRSVADLKGQKVATAKGSYMHRYLIGLLQKSGIDKQVTVVHLLTSEAQAALERGDVAAIAAATGAGPLLHKKGYPVIDEAIKHPDLPGTSVTVVTEAFLTKHPDLPQKWNQIKQQAVKDIKANSEEYYKFNAQVSGYPIDIVKASYSLDQFPEEPIPTKGLQLLEGTKKFLVSQKLAKSDFQLTDWIITQK
ncbi:aliphatic sulfonates ABC transporter substrate-binding protein [Scytonema sp. HK-05]|uniref:ABC transporter substrate-binding protein n=1 Tax=Scytonema sp. HK-05 TaxID=1137095 RepID=UPI0009FA56A2|nr:ABC transporter substrate-binding protein [Scytonema sp. HK-05]BAY49555.1 aliphatic sulfonates ABC transporter substrate-binding protein [Scytonema sp. HK-05]